MKEHLITGNFILSYLTMYIHFMMGIREIVRYYLLVILIKSSIDRKIRLVSQSSSN